MNEREFIAEAYKRINSSEKNLHEKSKLFREQVLPLTEYRGITNQILGDYRARLVREDIQKLNPTVRNQIPSLYADSLVENETFKNLPEGVRSYVFNEIYRINPDQSFFNRHIATPLLSTTGSFLKGVTWLAAPDSEVAEAVREGKEQEMISGELPTSVKGHFTGAFTSLLGASPYFYLIGGAIGGAGAGLGKVGVFLRGLAPATKLGKVGRIAALGATKALRALTGAPSAHYSKELASLTSRGAILSKKVMPWLAKSAADSGKIASQITMLSLLNNYGIGGPTNAKMLKESYLSSYVGAFIGTGIGGVLASSSNQLGRVIAKARGKAALSLFDEGVDFAKTNFARRIVKELPHTLGVAIGFQSPEVGIKIMNDEPVAWGEVMIDTLASTFAMLGVSAVKTGVRKGFGLMAGEGRLEKKLQVRAKALEKSLKDTVGIITDKEGKAAFRRYLILRDKLQKQGKLTKDSSRKLLQDSFDVMNKEILKQGRQPSEGIRRMVEDKAFRDMFFKNMNLFGDKYIQLLGDVYYTDGAAFDIFLGVFSQETVSKAYKDFYTLLNRDVKSLRFLPEEYKKEFINTWKYSPFFYKLQKMTFRPGLELLERHKDFLSFMGITTTEEKKLKGIKYTAQAKAGRILMEKYIGFMKEARQEAQKRHREKPYPGPEEESLLRAQNDMVKGARARLDKWINALDPKNKEIILSSIRDNLKSANVDPVDMFVARASGLITDTIFDLKTIGYLDVVFSKLYAAGERVRKKSLTLDFLSDIDINSRDWDYLLSLVKSNNWKDMERKLGRYRDRVGKTYTIASSMSLEEIRAEKQKYNKLWLKAKRIDSLLRENKKRIVINRKDYERIFGDFRFKGLIGQSLRLTDKGGYTIDGFYNKFLKEGTELRKTLGITEKTAKKAFAQFATILRRDVSYTQNEAGDIDKYVTHLNEAEDIHLKSWISPSKMTDEVKAPKKKGLRRVSEKEKPAEHKLPTAFEGVNRKEVKTRLDKTTHPVYHWMVSGVSSKGKTFSRSFKTEEEARKFIEGTTDMNTGEIRKPMTSEQIVKEGGGIWGGRQKGEKPSDPTYAVVTDPKSKSTLYIPEEGLTADKVRARIKAKQLEFGIGVVEEVKKGDIVKLGDEKVGRVVKVSDTGYEIISQDGVKVEKARDNPPEKTSSQKLIDRNSDIGKVDGISRKTSFDYNSFFVSKVKDIEMATNLTDSQKSAQLLMMVKLNNSIKSKTITQTKYSNINALRDLGILSDSEADNIRRGIRGHEYTALIKPGGGERSFIQAVDRFIPISGEKGLIRYLDATGADAKGAYKVTKTGAQITVRTYSDKEGAKSFVYSITSKSPETAKNIIVNLAKLGIPVEWNAIKAENIYKKLNYEKPAVERDIKGLIKETEKRIRELEIRGRVKGLTERESQHLKASLLTKDMLIKNLDKARDRKDGKVEANYYDEFLMISLYPDKKVIGKTPAGGKMMLFSGDISMWERALTEGLQAGDLKALDKIIMSEPELVKRIINAGSNPKKLARVLVDAKITKGLRDNLGVSFSSSQLETYFKIRSSARKIAQMKKIDGVDEDSFNEAFSSYVKGKSVTSEFEVYMKALHEFVGRGSYLAASRKKVISASQETVIDKHKQDLREKDEHDPYAGMDMKELIRTADSFSNKIRDEKVHQKDVSTLKSAKKILGINKEDSSDVVVAKVMGAIRELGKLYKEVESIDISKLSKKSRAVVKLLNMSDLREEFSKFGEMSDSLRDKFKTYDNLKFFMGPGAPSIEEVVNGIKNNLYDIRGMWRKYYGTAVEKSGVMTNIDEVLTQFRKNSKYSLQMWTLPLHLDEPILRKMAREVLMEKVFRPNEELLAQQDLYDRVFEPKRFYGANVRKDRVSKAVIDILKEAATLKRRGVYTDVEWASLMAGEKKYGLIYEEMKMVEDMFSLGRRITETTGEITKYLEGYHHPRTDLLKKGATEVKLKDLSSSIYLSLHRFNRPYMVIGFRDGKDMLKNLNMVEGGVDMRRMSDQDFLMTYDTPAEAKARAKELKKSGYSEVVYGRKSPYIRSMFDGLTQNKTVDVQTKLTLISMLSEQELADKTAVDMKDISKIKLAVEKEVLKRSTFSSVTKLKRKFVGFDDTWDNLRDMNMDTYKSLGFFLNRLKSNEIVNRSIEELRTKYGEDSPYTKYALTYRSVINRPEFSSLASKTANAFRLGLYAQHLAMKTSFVALQLSQNPIIGIPYLMSKLPNDAGHKLFGIASKYIFSGYYMNAAHNMIMRGEVPDKMRQFPYYKEMLQDYRKATAQGITSGRAGLTEYLTSYNPDAKLRRFNRFKKGIGWVGEQTEGMNRGAMFFSSYTMARDKLKMNRHQAYDFAFEAIAKVEGIYGKYNFPMAVEKMPTSVKSIVKTVATFRLFDFNLMHVIGKDLTANYGKPLGAMAGMLTVLGGLSVYSFAHSLLTPLIEFVTKKKVRDSEHDIYEFTNRLVSQMPIGPEMEKNITDLLYYGAPSAVGISAQQFIPVTSTLEGIAGIGKLATGRGGTKEAKALIGAPAGTSADIGRLTTLLSQGRMWEATENVPIFSLSAYRNASKAIRWFMNNQAETYGGEFLYDMDLNDTIVKFFSLQPVKERKAYQMKKMEETISRTINEDIRNTLVRYENNIESGDNDSARKNMERVEELGREYERYFGSYPSILSKAKALRLKKRGVGRRRSVGAFR